MPPTPEPLDPAAIMAAHRYHRGADDGVIVGACAFTGRHKTTEHCATYLMAEEAVRLAAALAAAQDRERRVEALATKLEQWPNGPSYTVTARAILAALAGEGAADQPQGAAIP